MEKKHSVTLEVSARRFIPKTVRTEEFEFVCELENIECNSKLALLRACQQNFGRCTGVLRDEDGSQLGWKFEGKERDDNLEILEPVSWWETQVKITKGAKVVGMLHFL